MDGLKSSQSSSLRCLKCRTNELIIESISEKSRGLPAIVRLTCSKCELHFAYQDYAALFDKLNFIIGRLDVNNGNREVNRRQLADMGRWVNEYRGYLTALDDKYEIIEGSMINHAFRLFYVDFSKLLDSLARLHCNLGEFERASELTEKNIALLESMYSSKESKEGTRAENGQKQQFDIEIANEWFKLAEIQCNCEKWSRALASVNRAIEIADKLISKDNHLLDEFRSLKQNILSIIH